MPPTQTFVNKPTDYARYLMKLGFPQPPHYPIGVQRVHISSPNVEGMVFQIFWNKQRYCIQFITNEQVKLISFKFPMRGGWFHAGNTLCTFNAGSCYCWQWFYLASPSPAASPSSPPPLLVLPPLLLSPPSPSRPPLLGRAPPWRLHSLDLFNT